MKAWQKDDTGDTKVWLGQWCLVVAVKLSVDPLGAVFGIVFYITSKCAFKNQQERGWRTHNLLKFFGNRSHHFLVSCLNTNTQPNQISKTIHCKAKLYTAKQSCCNRTWRITGQGGKGGFTSHTVVFDPPRYDITWESEWSVCSENHCIVSLLIVDPLVCYLP